jgi:hypothetical protein
LDVAVDGASYTLSLICDDHSDFLDSPEYGRPILIFLPDILKLFRHKYGVLYVPFSSILFASLPPQIFSGHVALTV